MTSLADSSFHIGPGDPVAGEFAAGEPAYSWLFAAAAEPVVIVAAGSGRIAEANPAAATLLRRPRARLVGAQFLSAFDSASASALEGALTEARRAGKAAPVGISVLPTAAQLMAAVSSFGVAGKSYFLVRLSAKTPLESEALPAPSLVFDAIEGARIGFLVTDAALRIEYANQAFVEMAGLASLEELRGQSLSQWLSLSDQDSTRLHAQMSQREAVVVLAAQLIGERSPARAVEVHAVAVPDGGKSCWGFSVRDQPLFN